MIDYILTIIAGLITISAYVIYYFDIKKQSIVPSRFSWMIWSLTASLETLTYSYVSDDNLKSVCFVTSSLCCVLITAKIWMSSDRKVPNWAESSLAFCTVSIAIWLLFKSPFFAHILLLLAIPIAFLPTYKNALNNFENENSKAWLLWSISDLLMIVIIVIRLKAFKELPYAVVEFVCHFSVFLIIFYKQNFAAKSSYAKNNHIGNVSVSS
jgi:hypothetical protein